MMDMMSDFDYSLDVGEGGYKEEKFEWDNAGPPPGPMFNSRHSNNGFMNAQYSEAFGDYRGGYGPGGGFGPPRSRPYPPGPLMRGMMGPPRGRGYGIIGPPQRRGPPIHRAAQFLAKCDVSPQYIKILPRPLLDMILPDYCGLCVQNFDSFAMAKIHYNCKNHYKAQKKFMAQHKPIKYHKEMPMKARNLYCELCDVHITSTSHANSHYAGKSHHAIVEGRKVPKNPFLLQQGMENRIELLIRREKKILKAPVVEKVETKKPVERNAPPELICEICKTSVTCSEQMTNHLNGKRHLTKEKQHILNMMKGKAAENDPEEEEEAEEEEDDDEVTIVEENVADVQEGEGENPADPPAADHVDEWGAGGGAEWDTQNPTE